MKLQNIALTVLLSAASLLTAGAIEAQACGINAGEYSLGMCQSGNRKTYYYRVVNTSKHYHISYKIANNTYYLAPKTYREHSIKGEGSSQGVEFDRNIKDSGWTSHYVWITPSKQDSIRVVYNQKSGRIYPRTTDR